MVRATKGNKICIVPKYGQKKLLNARNLKIGMGAVICNQTS